MEKNRIYNRKTEYIEALFSWHFKWCSEDELWHTVQYICLYLEGLKTMYDTLVIVFQLFLLAVREKYIFEGQKSRVQRKLLRDKNHKMSENMISCGFIEDKCCHILFI